jgi:predicted transcriptional regulator
MRLTKTERNVMAIIWSRKETINPEDDKCKVCRNIMQNQNSRRTSRKSRRHTATDNIE